MKPTARETAQGVGVEDGVNDDGELQDVNIETTSANENDVAVAVQQQHISRRWTGWIVLFVASLVSIIALTLGRPKDTSAQKWAKWIVSLSIVFSFGAIICYHFARAVFLSGPPELALSGIALILWCIGLPIIMNPSNSIAVGYTQIVNGNMYIASWVCFFSIFFVVGDLLSEVYGFNIVATVRPRLQDRNGKWYTLVATSVIVMGASIRVFESFECNLDVMKSAPTCRDCKFAISAAVIGTVIALFPPLSFLFLHVTLTTVELILSVVMVIIWSFGLGFITFGQGPGHSIGNLFFATWATFILSCWIAADCYREWVGGTPSTDQQQQTELPNYESNGQAAVNGDEDL